MRLFLAVEPTQPVRDEAGRAARHLRRALPGLRARFAAAATTHLTLVFLGQVAQDDLAIVERYAATAVQACTDLEVHTAGLGAFPAARRPSVLWLGVADPGRGLARLQHELSAALQPLLPERGRQRFVPHLTLARITSLGTASRDEVAGALASFEPAPATWPIAEVVLFQSELRPDGAQHLPLVRWPLTSA